jgi:hypothetical protein
MGSSCLVSRGAGLRMGSCTNERARRRFELATSALAAPISTVRSDWVFRCTWEDSGPFGVHAERLTLRTILGRFPWVLANRGHYPGAGVASGVVHPLIAEPTPEQQSLLDLIYQGRRLASSTTQRRWPICQYVEQELCVRHQLDLMRMLSTCPTVGGQMSGGTYGWTWSSTRQPGDEIGLTVAGMAHVVGAKGDVELFLGALTVLVDAQRSFKPSPTQVREVNVGVADLGRALEPEGYQLGPAGLDSLVDALKCEPATWHCQVAPPEDGWTVTVSPFVRQFAEVDGLESYLERVIEWLTPPAGSPEPLYPSPLSLPEAIDYLNAVWRLHADHTLLRIGRAEAAAKLGLDAATVDEFESRLSALCAILDGLTLPGTDGHKLTDLDTYLHRELSDESAGRASEAVADLRALFGLRVWRQHEGTEYRAANAMARLGITLPVYDWGAAWQQVQARAVAALSALREEVETLSG